MVLLKGLKTKNATFSKRFRGSFGELPALISRLPSARPRHRFIPWLAEALAAKVPAGAWPPRVGCQPVHVQGDLVSLFLHTFTFGGTARQSHQVHLSTKLTKDDGSTGQAGSAAGSPARPLPPRRLLTKQAPKVRNLGSLAGDTAASSSKAPAAHEGDDESNAEFTDDRPWICDVCTIPFYARPGVPLYKVRNEHIAKAHKDVPRDRFRQICEAFALSRP